MDDPLEKLVIEAALAEQDYRDDKELTSFDAYSPQYINLASGAA